MSNALGSHPVRQPLNFALKFLRGNSSPFYSFAQLEQIFDLLPVGVACLNLEFQLIKINKTLAGWLDKTPSELIGRPLHEAVPIILSTRLKPELKRAADAGDALRPMTWRIPTNPDDRGRKYKATLVPLQNGNPQPQELLLVVEDITSLQRATEKRQRTLRDLRRQRLALMHARRGSMKGDLAASLVHELNQPLTAILSNAQAALRILSADPAQLAEVREILQDIVADDKRAGEVIRRMRALFRKNELELVPLALNQLVLDVEKILRTTTSLHSGTIHLELTPDLPQVQGDPILLQQVLLNLALNAFDAMSQTDLSEPVLQISTRRTDSEMLQITVTDTGHGVNPDHINRIFEPFYTTKEAGLGMGLSIARSIVEAHKGRLWAEPNTPRGTRFHMTLPIPK